MWKKFNEWLSHSGLVRPVFTPRPVQVRDREFQLRRMVMTDVPQALDMEQRIYGDLPWGRGVFMSEVQKRTRAIYIVCVELQETERILGFVGVNFYSNRAHVTNIAVDPDRQHQGLGRMLMETAIEIAQRYDRRRMTLEVRVDNAAAQHLYHQLGFTNGRIRQNYYEREHMDAMDMELVMD